jgi:hypothetical protein
MKARKIYPISIMMMLLATLLLAACSQAITGPAKSNLSPQQVISKSSDAMKQVKSSHFVSKTDTSFQLAGASAGKGTIPIVQNTNASSNGSGDIQGSDSQFSTVTTSGSTQTKLAEVSQGNKLYIQNQTGKWYVLDKSKLQASATSNLPSSISGNSIDQQSILALIQDAKVVDYGDQTVNGTSLRHLSVSLDKQAFSQVIAQNSQLKGLFGQQDINQLLNSTKSFNTTADVYIDESKFYIHQFKWNIDMSIDMAQVAKQIQGTVTNQSIPIGIETLKFTTTEDLSNFNAPVTFNIPQNATPTDNLLTAFGATTTGATIPNK